MLNEPINADQPILDGGGADTAVELWSGEGEKLYMDDHELRLEWITGAATRSKNVIAIALDQLSYVKMVQRSRPSILLAALVLGVVVPFYFNLIDGNYECVGKVNEEYSSAIMGSTMAIVLALLIGYMCTLKTTLIFGAPCGPIGAHIHLLGRDATENGEEIIRKIMKQRSLHQRLQKMNEI